MYWGRSLRHVFGVLLLLGCSACATPRIDASWTGPDKFRHLVAAGLVSAATAQAVEREGANDGEAVVAGVAVVMTLGAGKEWIDREIRKTGWSWPDMMWNLLGGVLGGYLATADN
jgi:putative lipoprotein